MSAHKIRMAKARTAQAAAVAVTAVVLIGSLATTAGANAASDKAQAKKHLLVLADMPKGWSTEKGTGGSSGSSNFPGVKQLAACLGVPSSLISSNPPAANGPYYQNKDQSLEVQDTVTVFPSVRIARAQFAAISSAKTPGCTAAIMNTPSFKSQIESSAGKGASIGTITITAVDPSRYGRNTSGFTMNLPITAQGISVTGHLTELYFIKGRLGQNISFDAYGATFPASVAKHLTSVAQGRL